MHRSTPQNVSPGHMCKRCGDENIPHVRSKTFAFIYEPFVKSVNSICGHILVLDAGRRGLICDLLSAANVNSEWDEEHPYRVLSISTSVIL